MSRSGPALFSPMLGAGRRPSITVARGRGMELTLGDGRTVLDAGSLSSCIVGHCAPEVVAAVRAAADTVYVSELVGYAAREEVAQELLRIGFADESWAESVAFFLSAGEAAELGLLLAQQLTGREAIVCRRNGYHGSVGLAREASVHPLWGAALSSSQGGVTPRLGALAPIRPLPVPDCWTGDVSDAHDCSASCLRDAPAALHDAAAAILDVSQGGAYLPPQYVDTLAAMAHEAGALWIADETVTSFGRLGHRFAFQRGARRPDVVQLGKGLTGGAAPGGALVLSRETAARLDGRRWMTASTYRGHPLTLAATSAVLRIVERDGLVERAASLGDAFGRDLREIAAAHPSAERVIGEGLMWIVKLTAPPAFAEGTWHGEGAASPPAELVQRAALDAGVFLGGYSGDAVWLVPPLIATAAQLAQAARGLDAALSVADRHLELAA